MGLLENLLRPIIDPLVDKQLAEKMLHAPGAYSSAVLPAAKSRAYLENYSNWVYANVNVIARKISDLELLLYRVNRTGEKEEVKQHELIETLYRVNNHMTLSDLLHTTQTHLDLLGEAMWYIPRTSAFTKPKEIFPIRPDLVKVIPGDPEKGEEFIHRYEYTPPGSTKKILFESFEILFFKYPDPASPFRGYSPLKAIATIVDTDNYAWEWNARFFENSAQVDAVLQTDAKLNDDQFKRIMSQWEAKYRGPRNARRTAILEGGLKYQATQITPREMEFRAQQEWTRDAIMAMYQNTKVVLGITTDVNRCFSDDHEILTTDGWKTVYELSRGDYVGTWNLEEQKMEYQKPSEICKYDYEGELIEYKNGRLDLAVTPNHRMLHQSFNDKRLDGNGSWKTEEAQSIEDRAITRIPITAGGLEGTNDMVVIPEVKYGATGKFGNRPKAGKYILDPVIFAKFVGFYIAEGWRKKCEVSLGQTVEGKYQYMLDILSDLPFGKWREYRRASKSKHGLTGRTMATVHNSNKTLAYWLMDNVGDGHANKRVPEFIFQGSEAVKKAFLEGLTAGDGYRYSESTFAIRTTSLGLVDDLQRLGTEIGLGTSVNTTNVIPLVIFSERNVAWIKRKSVRRVQYDGLVWCVTVPNAYIIVRRNGRVAITGNSNAEASEVVWLKHSIAPRANRIISTLNEFFVPIFGKDLFLEFKNFIPEDKQTKLAEYSAGVGRWMTPNEIREKEGLKPIEGGDSLNTQPSFGLFDDDEETDEQ